ncbi:unnamed protein product [Clavelina lepadiformis]|uniref:Iodothyronine deiodinase n=1 Tax=Clavelina lepadiformis TaxID=159417 RepID=A0ABP0EXG9_CLALP
MNQIASFKEILDRYSKLPADFLVVYIEEAHALDGWSFDWNQFKLRQPTNMKERLQAAEMFVEHTQVSCPVVIDNFKNEASHAYGALPERLYIILNGAIAYEGREGPFGYDLLEMENALKKML